MPAPTLSTTRLALRPWRDDDLDAFARLNADPDVMAHFPKTLSREESDAAVEARGIADFIGFTGLSVPAFDAPFMPAIEIGWRFARAFWGHGYATEAAAAALDHAFGVLGHNEIVSITVPANIRSRAVMERLGMRRDPAEDFDHPVLPEGHPLRRHVLYRITPREWLNSSSI